MGDLDLTECVAIMTEKARKVQSGDLSEPEAILMAQAVTLDLIFGTMARRAALNMSEYLNAAETYLRLGLKAQAQCRATLETLAEIKNPPRTSFVKQANVAIGGPQQINNQRLPESESRARAGDSDSRTNEVLDVLGEVDGARVDPGPSGSSGAIDSPVAAVEGVNRPTY